MTDESPAIKVLRKQVEDVTTELNLHHLKDRALRVVGALQSMVNTDSTMTEEQASHVQGYIIDHMASRDHYPPFPERAMIASYINSCKA